MILGSLFQKYLSLILGLTAFYLHGCCVYELNFRQKLLRLLACFPLLFLIAAIAATQTNGVLAFSAVSICFFLCSFYIFKDTPLDTFFIFLCIYIMLIFIQMLSLPLIQLLGLSVHSFFGALLKNLFTLAISIIHYKFAHLTVIRKFVTNSGVLSKTIIGNSFILLYAIAYFNESDLRYYLLSFLVALLLLCINGAIIYTSLRMNHQKQQLEMYQEYLPIIEQLIDHTRETQHAHNNCIQAIRMLPATCKDYDSLCHELTDYTDYLIAQNTPISLLKINLKMTAGFLYSKMLSAEEFHKKLDIKIENYNLKTDTPEYDLITMLGILIDNAIEATSENGISYAVLDSKNNKLLFQIKNVGPKLTPDFCAKIFQKGYTTKNNQKKSHGIGLYQLKHMVDSYHGEIALYNENESDTTYLCFELMV